MPKTSHPLRLIRSLIFLCIVVSTTAVDHAAAATLYDRSLALLNRHAAQADPENFSFVVMGDSRTNESLFRKVLRRAATYHPLFILHGGDIGEGGSLVELNRFLRIVSQEANDIPVFVVRGNHEQDLRLFRELIGPQQFTIDLPRLNTITAAVDNSDYELTSSSLAYLKKALTQPRRHHFVMMHIPPRTTSWNWHTFADGASELFSMLVINRPEIAFFSHVHQFACDDSRGYPMVITGGAGAQLYPKGKFPGYPLHHFVLVRIEQGEMSAEVVKIK